MKKLFFLMSLFFIFLPITGYAAQNTVDDQANLFSPQERSALSSRADALNEKIKGEVFIVTTTTNEDEPRTFANEQLRDRVGNNNNGALLLIDMNQRQVYVSTSGNMIDYLTDRRIDDILDSVTEGLQTQDYNAAATSYLTKMSGFVDDGIPRGTYRIDEKTGKITYYRSITPVELTIGLVVAFIGAAAFFFFVTRRYQLKSGGYRYPYREQANVELTTRDDRLVNSFVTTRRIPRPSNNGGGGGGSTTNSSGGGTFGGGGRGF